MKVEKWKSQHPPLLHISFPFALQGLNEEGEKKEKGGGGGSSRYLINHKGTPKSEVFIIHLFSSVRYCFKCAVMKRPGFEGGFIMTTNHDVI